MSGFATNTTEHLIRSDVWSRELKAILEDELQGMQYVRWIQDEFPDGETFHIPSIGQAQADDYTEGNAVQFRAMDTGDFTFSVTEYKTVATYITDKMKGDAFYTSEIISLFVPRQQRALMVELEKDIMALSNDQTSGDQNLINGGAHRFVATGTSGAMDPADFAAAKFSLKKAAVPMENLVAIVDPSVEYDLSTLTNLVNVSNNPKWEGIVRDGMSSGMRFLMNVYGFDVYVSNYLVDNVAETIGSRSVTAGVANMLFSAADVAKPFIGAMRQMPKVESDRDIKLLRDEYVTSARWGTKLYRPESLVVILTESTTPDFG